MVILMDVGNTRVKYCRLAADGSVDEMQAVQHRDNATPQQLVHDLLQQYQPQTLVLVHVLGDAFQQAVEKSCAAIDGELILAQTGPECCGVRNGYSDYRQLGNDRFVALVAARSMATDKNCVVIDCGSAVTIDALDHQGLHRGGVIFPGMQNMLKTLTGNTQLTMPDRGLATFDNETLADNTSDGIISGCRYAFVGAIQYHLDRIASDIKGELLVLATGGDAEIFACYSEHQVTVIPDLIMRGLKRIYKERKY